MFLSKNKVAAMLAPVGLVVGLMAGIFISIFLLVMRFIAKVRNLQ